MNGFSILTRRHEGAKFPETDILSFLRCFVPFSRSQTLFGNGLVLRNSVSQARQEVLVPFGFFPQRGFVASCLRVKLSRPLRERFFLATTARNGLSGFFLVSWLPDFLIPAFNLRPSGVICG